MPRAQRREGASGYRSARSGGCSATSASTAARIEAIRPATKSKAASGFEGRAGAIELFVAGERRIDPYPVEFGVAQWFTAGFRLLSSLVWTIIDEYAPPEPIDSGSPCSHWRPSSRWRMHRCMPLSVPRSFSTRSRRSPNGLRVILSEDHSTPIVHVSVWYHVGSKNERAGRTGFAHLFEHMMFKGSKNVEPESHTSIIASVGGRSNAYTTEDETVFWQTLPAQYLPLALWLEADRMATLRIDDEAFKREREVVKEERRMRVENQPYGRLSEIIYDNAFTTHPYKHPTIGSMADLEAASIDDVREFHSTYYVPENATVDDRRRLRLARRRSQMVTQYFAPRAEGGAARAARHPEGAAADEGTPRRRRGGVAAAGGRRRVSRHLRRASRTRIRCTSPSKILSDGAERADSARARLQQADCADRVRQRQHHRGSEPVLRGGDRAARADAGGRRAGADRRVREAEAASRSPASELQRAKNQFARDYIVGRESNEDKALHLAHAAVIHNDITTADGEFDIFMNVTTSRHAARGEDLLHAERTASCSHPAEGARRGLAMSDTARVPARECQSERRRCWDLGVGRVLWSWRLAGLRADRRTGRLKAPPRPLAAREVKFPPYEMRTLPTACRSITVLHHEQPAVTMRLLVRAGAAQDPEGKGGVADLVAKLLDQGTTTRSAQQIADQIDFIGGALGTGSGTDLTFVNAVVMKDSFAVGDGSRRRRRAQPGVCSGGDRAAEGAGAVVAARQRRGSGLHRVDALRSPGLRLPSVRAARQRHAGDARRASRATICRRSTASTSCRTT